MSLSLYKKKRSFDQTPEPAGEQIDTKEPLRFVIQKHDASRLHYDFRLEMDGVLKSWAVPKGPSLNPNDKRLAMMVEDHPYDYRSFEGIIPKGNYGAGTVIVWDEGTYEPMEPVEGGKKEQEKLLLAQLEKGDVKIRLHGSKINGDFALVHIHGRDSENTWLLIKKHDSFASESDITKKDKSVVSGLTLAEVAETSTNEWQSNRPSPEENKKVKAGRTAEAVVNKPKKTTPAKDKETGISTVKKAKKTSAAKAKKVEQEGEIEEPGLTALIKKGEKTEMPVKVKPMLATLVQEASDDKDWIYEVKWDGYRAIGHVQKGKVELYSRNNISFNGKFYPVAEALKSWKNDVVVDGEIITLNDEGVPDFQQLQAWQKSHKGNLVYYLFDVLWVDGYSTMNLPLRERKEILRRLVPDDENGLIRYSDHIDESGRDFYKVALDKGLEGVMAKRADSTYRCNVRTQDWLKIKTHHTQEAVIAGFTEARGGRKHFGALILGIYSNNEFIYIGHTGSGLDDKGLASLYKKLQPLITSECPFKKKPKTNMAPTWVQPKIVCEVKYQEWTKDNLLRIPIFLRLREDKKAVEIKKEEAIEVTEAVEDKPEPKKKPAAKKASAPGKMPAATPSKSKTKKSADVAPLVPDPKEKDLVVTVSKQELKLTHLDKLYWPDEKLTKRDLLNYYNEVMPFILPYMKDRPQSLNRHPQGIKGPNFFQKDVKDKVADWLTKYKYFSESTREEKQFLVCTDEASLLYMANLGCIEMNPWHSRTESAEHPDWCVIDLDPDDISFDKVIEAANVVKKVLDALEVPSYCKTSGATGLHIYIPLEAKYDYDQSRQLAELIVTLVHDEIPSFTSLERNPAKRKGKIYLDFLQNRTIQTIAAPYSLRPKPGATASTPLHWEEVKKGLAMASFTMLTIFDRLKNEGDLFSPVLGKGIDLEKVIEKAGSLFK